MATAGGDGTIAAEPTPQGGGTVEISPDEEKSASANLSALISSGADDQEIAAAVVTLGGRRDQRELAALASVRANPSAVVRRAVAEALPMAMVEADESAVGVDALIELFDDENAEVRDWAVCSLGRTLVPDVGEIPAPYDTPRVRAALTVRLDDEDPATRAEACAGLALRGDLNVIEPLKRELASPTVGRVPVIAAEAIASPQLYDALIALRSWWTRDPDLLERAIRSTSRSET